MRPVPEILSASETSSLWFGVNGSEAQPNGRSGRRVAHGVRRLTAIRLRRWTVTGPALEPDSSRQQREEEGRLPLSYPLANDRS